MTAGLMMADLMTANGVEADRGGPHKLLTCGRGPTNGMVILNKSGKKLKKCSFE